jgi:hypothetical protein
MQIISLKIKVQKRYILKEFRGQYELQYSNVTQAIAYQ